MSDVIEPINMVDHEQLDAPPRQLMLQHSEEAAILAAALTAVRMTEGRRRVGNIVVVFAGWFVAALLIIPMVMCMQIIKNQPIPKDRIFVAVEREDGSIPNPAKPVDDQTATEHENSVKKFIYDYTDYRISYDAGHIKTNYDHTRFTTAGQAQTDYVKLMTDDADRPTEVFGAPGQRQVTHQAVSRVGPDAFEDTYTVKVRTKQGVWQPEETCRARVTIGQFGDMPSEVAQRIDPLKLVVLLFTTHPDPFDPTVKTSGCGR